MKTIKTMKEMIHKHGIKLMMTANRLFFNRKIQARMDPMTTATGYRDITNTKETLFTFTPLSKLINESPQMTNHGNNEIKYKI